MKYLFYKNKFVIINYNFIIYNKMLTYYYLFDKKENIIKEFEKDEILDLLYNGHIRLPEKDDKIDKKLKDEVIWVLK
jgi:hypothetical protein